MAEPHQGGTQLRLAGDHLGPPLRRHSHAGQPRAGGHRDQPVVNWSPSPAVSAIAIYEGKAFPRWRGNFLMGSLKQMDLFRIVLDGDRPVVQEIILHGVAPHSRCSGSLRR
jgi:glucose/arabinose dehydrogenase